ncbi:solute carrier family 2, facilitated glucose transporter member 5-like [Notechis scutatus]|uniref:Solute carrier family 2, facilitated glucose transporter member 5 n=1 Tax=Notechis scutatus TaxID=8663 RepID=A0A6J1VN75_9SAUR|nr:solute carrier family 2, facilitated glucose transporter member 5-like [Notechis scutatus]
MYLLETSPLNMRGSIGMVPQFFLVIGVQLAQIFAFPELLGTVEGWPVLVSLPGLLAIWQILLLPSCPESPRYLLMQKKEEEEAREVLKHLRLQSDVEDELEELRREDLFEKDEKNMNALRLLCYRPLHWNLVSVVIIETGQQLSGVNVVYYYADRIYSNAGIEENHVQFVTVGTGAVNVLMTIVAVFVVEALGRRILLLAGFGICCAACTMLTIALNLKAIWWMPYISIACVIIYVVGHAIGASPIPSVMIMEMFLQSSRPAAFMVGGSVHWLSNFTVGLVFTYLEQGLGPYCFLIFGAVCLATAVYVFLIVPETKNKTFMEINQIMAKRNGTEDPGEKDELKDFTAVSVPYSKKMDGERSSAL